MATKTKTDEAPPDLRTGERRGHDQGDDRVTKPYDGGTNPGAELRSKAESGPDLPTGARSHL